MLFLFGPEGFSFRNPDILLIDISVHAKYMPIRKDYSVEKRSIRLDILQALVCKLRTSILISFLQFLDDEVCRETCEAFVGVKNELRSIILLNLALLSLLTYLGMGQKLN